MKKTTTKNSNMTDTVKIAIAVNSKAYAGYKVGGVPGAVIGGLTELVKSMLD